MRRLVVMAVLAPMAAGCFWAVAGGGAVAGAYIWKQGRLSRNYNQPLATTFEGALHALNVLGYKVTRIDRGEYRGFIQTPYNKTDTLTVSLEKWTETETRVIVRAGVLGDRAISEQVHDEINKALLR